MKMDRKQFKNTSTKTKSYHEYSGDANFAKAEQKNYFGYVKKSRRLCSQPKSFQLNPYLDFLVNYFSESLRKVCLKIDGHICNKIAFTLHARF